MSDTRFCSNCGAELSATANFCGSCGKQFGKAGERVAAPIQPPAAAWPQTQPASAQETVIGVIPGGMRRSGFMGLKMEAFVIVLTTSRILFAAQTSEMMKANIQRARDQAKQQGKNFFGQWGAQFGANSGEEYLCKSPQFILAEQPTNFYINADQLRSIHLWESQSSDENSVNSTYYIEFEIPGGKHKFSFNALNIREQKRRLQQFYGNIVR